MSPLPELNKETPIAVIAAGRLGSSLAIALDKAGYNVAAISSRQASHREWLNSRIENAVVVQNPQTAVNVANIVFIAAPDASIEEICSDIDWRTHQAVIHCAGVLPLAALDKARIAGAETAGFHPLQTFPSADSSERLKDVSFATESVNPALFYWLRILATELGGSAFQIESSQRAAYHASAVMACGLLAGLTGLAAEMWESLGISREDALKRLIPLLRATVDALDEKGLPDAITGPFVRGDVETIIAHMNATSAKSQTTGGAYAALAEASLHIAKEQGGLSETAYERIKSLLSDENQT
ncbi:Rossmann-like and DUF2520 domain-containing protein [Candidatus Lucifugimonas marina]|jgi:predicted short-subunit dehydrogenase-like oxidoreductase (DUF2520 family)|uniref:DUF2520 domain-containing protein n=1 Tax=Candidatus Lucifugimonas marina TaxID=3038979 RepID=A0AAJ6CU59_9CHLR|nr:DUF2520 domain-containing protein [SAR202 cluster bacterium JH702]MDG0870124.1 DUF2520 domain-containing protein [SAR202 cluster bacterium JH639]WFG36319.1 DUF2520 domain-containing protein [SAR202 cluster bacterium JH545]WFG40252.1 DUF2520 domain-containing protein [SAR202 cluster bacterium JH1073]